MKMQDYDFAVENNFQLSGSFPKGKCPFRRICFPVNLLCRILVQLFGMKTRTHSSVLKIVITLNIILKNIS